MKPRDENERPRVLGILRLALGIGEVMLESSVAVSDVDIALRRLTDALGLRRCQVSVTLNVITLSYLMTGDDDPITMITVVDSQEPEMHRLIRVEQLVRRLESGEIDIDDGRRELAEIEEADAPHGPPIVLAASLVSVAAWVVFAGGALPAALAAMGAWLVVTPLLAAMARTRVPSAFGIVAAASIITAAPYLVDWAGGSLRVQAAVAGGLYPLLPGGLLVASVTDGLSSAPLSSLAKALQTIVIGLAIALGVLAVLTLSDTLDIEPTGAAERWPMVVTTVAAGVACGALAVARSAPFRPAIIAGALGATTSLIALTGSRHELDGQLTTFVAAVGLGLGAALIGRREATSHTVYSAFAIYAIVPGVTLYLAMFALTQQADALANQLLQDAIRIAVAVAAGLALGLAAGSSIPPPRRRVLGSRRSTTSASR